MPSSRQTPGEANTGAMKPPTIASRLWDWSLTTFMRTSNVCRNHTATLATKMIVNALVTNPLALSHASMSVVLIPGRR